MYNPIKRLIDILISLILIIILSPILLFTYLTIQMNSGRPITFVQKRVKKNGKIFLIYKFRTMIEKASLFQKKGFTDKELSTKEGWILRKLHFDELPQLFNIFKGDMSLIGPRPPTMKDYKHHLELDPNYKKIFSNKPGLISLDGVLAYINSKKRKKILNKLGLELSTVKNKHSKYSEEYHEKKKQREYYYLNNKSFILDLRIFLWTIVMFFDCCKRIFTK